MQDTDGNRYIWDELLRQWVPVTGAMSPAELANEMDPVLRGRYAPVPPSRRVGKTVYISSTGDDSTGTGTAAAPYATPTKAITELGAAKLPVIKVISTATNPIREFTSTTYSGGSVLTIEPAEGYERAYIYGSAGHDSGWSNTTGTIYTKNLGASSTGYAGTISQVYDRTQTDTVGDRTWWKKLTRNVATPTTPGVGEFGWTRPNMWVNTGDDANDHEFEVPRLSDLVAGAGSTIVLRNLVMLGVNGDNVRADTGGTVLAYNCEFGYAAGSGIATRNSGVMKCYDCVSYRNVNDGFNVAGTGSGELVRCDGSYNDDEGASPHNTAVLTVRSSRFTYNVQSGIACVDASVINGEDVVFYGNHRSGAIAGQGGLSMLGTSSGTVTDFAAIDNVGAGIIRAATSTAVLSDYDSGTDNGNGAADNLAYA